MRNMGTQDLPEDVSNVTIATMKIVLISHPFEDSRDMCVQYFKTRATTDSSHLMRLLRSSAGCEGCHSQIQVAVEVDVVKEHRESGVLRRRRH